jgi:2,4-dienoyl-CoA reductase-like NADH-dependent reductase (Old Yellow Enzyme family)
VTCDALFEPFALGRYVLPNRIVMAPMTRARSPMGVPGADVAAYYRRRAEGGVGLIITEGTWIDHPAASNDESAPRFHGEDALAGWRRVVDEVHATGGLIMPQLWHTGLTRRPVSEHIYDVIEEDLSAKVSPSGFVMPGEKVGEGMTESEIADLVEAYAQGAATAEKLGFDGIEIHGAHGYMVDQFFWHETNKRIDRYGGDLRARARFGVEMIRACRARVSPDFPIILRFSQWKLADYDARLAHSPAELETLLGPLADAGVDLFHASQRRYWLPEFEGSTLNLAGWAKKLTGKPSMTVGSVGLTTDMTASLSDGQPSAAADVDGVVQMLAKGEVDLVAVGRVLLSDPEWPRKVRAGDLAGVRPFSRNLLATLD